MMAYGGQAAPSFGAAGGALQAGFDSRRVGDWLDGGAQAVAQAADSLANAAAGAQSLTAWLAARKDGAS